MHEPDRLCWPSRTRLPTMLDGSNTDVRWRKAAGFGVLAGLFLGACGAGTRALPDEIAPLPRHAQFALAADGGVVPRAEDGGPRALSVARAKSERDSQDTCSLRVRHVSPSHMTVGRDVFDVVRRSALSHFRAVTDSAGAIRGVAVYDVDPGSCMDALGFQEDDVIVNVNGFDFATPDAYREMYESIDADSRAVVHVERGADTLERVFDLSRPP